MARAYEVRMRDAVENTGLEGQLFATRAEAGAAASIVNGDYPQAQAHVVETEGEPTITLAEWASQTWR